MWTQETTDWTGKIEDFMCEFCGLTKETPEHVIWVCPCFEEKRREHDRDLADLNPDVLPAALKVGVAPSMSANPMGPFLGK